MRSICYLLVWCCAGVAGAASGGFDLPQWRAVSAGTPAARLAVVRDGNRELLAVTPTDAAEYQGVEKRVTVDATGVTRLRFRLRSETVGNFFCYLTQSDGTACYRAFGITPGAEPQEVVLDLTPAEWTWNDVGAGFREIASVRIYSPEMHAPYSFQIGDIEFVKPGFQPVSGITYRYLAKPERGDSSGTMLQEDKRIPEEQTFWGIRTEGEPGIVFDLGKEYFIHEIRIESFADPAQNFRSATVAGSSDGREFTPVAMLVNDNAGRQPQWYRVGGAVDTVARYWRLTFNRAKVDNAVEVARVEFSGTADLTAVAIPKMNVWRRPEAIAEPGSEHCVTLGGDRFRIAVDRRNGCVAAVASGGEARIAAGYEEYHRENRAGTTVAMEFDDRVTGFVPGADTLEFIAENPGLPGVVIRKRYTLNPDADRVRKEIAFESNASAGGGDFVTVKTVTCLDPAYRAGGSYFGADWGLGGRMAANQVKFDSANMVHAGGNSKIGFFRNPGVRENIGQYLLKVNGRTVSGTLMLWQEKDNIPLTYTPYGWMFGLATLPLVSGRPVSVEYELLAYAGDETGFYRAYRATPEIRAKYDRYASAVPAWLGGIKCTIPANVYHETVGWMRCFDADGAILGVYNGPNLWGDWVGEGDGVTGYGGTGACSAIRDDFRRLRDEFPNGRFGIYCWAWSGSPFSQAFRNHPEWFFSRDKENRLWSAYGCGCARNFLRDVGEPDSARALLDGAASIMEHIGGDFFYLDGGSGGTNVIDWPSGRVSQLYDWDTFHEALKDTVKKSGGDKIMFFNSRSEWCYDFGIIEGIQNRFGPKWWRDSADSLLALKIRQSVDPLRRVSPYYWLDDSAQYYANYVIGLGLPPAVWDNPIPRIAYISAAYETRGFQWFDAARGTPDWRSDAETPLELFALRNGAAPVLAVIRHGASAQPDRIALDWSASDSATAPEQPWYVWKFTLADIAPRIAAQYGVPEPLSAELYSTTGFGVNLVGIPEFLGTVTGNAASIATALTPERLTLIVFSRGPAWIYSLHGRRTNFWLDRVGDAALEVTEAGPDAIRFSRNFTTEAEALVLLPDDWRDVAVTGGRLRTLLPWGDRHFAIVELPEGGDRVVLTPQTRGVAAPVGTGSLDVRVTADSRLQINVPGASGVAALRIEDADGVPVYTGNTALPVDLTLPRELRSGRYQVYAETARGSDRIRGEGGFSLQNSWRYALENSPLIYGRTRAIRPPAPEITPQHVTAGSWRILQSAIDSSDSFDGRAVAGVDAVAGKVRVGSLAQPLSWAGADDWSYAGIEVEKAAVVAVEAVSNMKDVYADSAVSPNFAYPGKNSFCGLMIDYHTPRGYTRRVALSLGKLDPGRDTIRPGFGAVRVPERFLVLEDLIGTKERGLYTLNLKSWAPDDWDGRVWLSAGVEGVTPNRHIEVTFQAAEDTAATDIGTDLAAPPPVWQLPLIDTAGFRADGVIDEAFYSGALGCDRFYNMPDLTPPAVPTRLKLAADADWLYVTAELSDTRAFLADSDELWENDGIDIGFGDADGKLRQQLIVDAAGRTFHTNGESTVPGGAKPLDVTVGVRIRDGVATIEAAIRKRSILTGEMAAQPHGAIRFNVARYRRNETTPERGEIHSLTPIRQWNLGDPALFGTLRW